MKNPLFPILACCFSTQSIANGAVIFEFNSSPGAGTVLSDANAGQDATFSLGDGVDAGSALNYLGLSGTTDLGNAFTFDVVVSPAGMTTDVSVAPNNGSLVETGGPQFATGDGILITVSNISDSDIVLDGFTNFGTDFSGTGEGFTIDGVTYLRGTDTNGDDDPRRGIILPGGSATEPGLLTGNSAQVDFVGTSVGLRGFAIQFTDNTVPEPSAALLLGLGLVGFGSRRRRL